MNSEQQNNDNNYHQYFFASEEVQGYLLELIYIVTACIEDSHLCLFTQFIAAKQ